MSRPPTFSYQPYYSSHYAQAYAQLPPQPYAGPSNYVPTTIKPCPPGHSRCSYKGCLFTGAPKPLEIHMMDRHLIYPPGWDRRQKKPEWDADPCLKGKPVPIQGTNLILDKPEDIEAWIAERKRRWPTTQRVEEKKRKMDEAISRGQLPEPSERFKRQRTDVHEVKYHDRGRGRGRGRGNNSSRGRGRVTDAGWQGRTSSNIEAHMPTMPTTIPGPSTNTLDSGDESPEAVSSKAPLVSHPVDIPLKSHPDVGAGTQRTSNNHKASKRPPPQPRKEPFNPFASRPTLLRNLLLPEIRVTISNLSQAIRFLVDNEFLEGVELTPGAAESKLIQVIAEDASVTQESLIPT